MSVEFSHVRVIDLTVFVPPDLNPNVADPDPRWIFSLRERPVGTNLLTTGNEIFFDFRDTGGAPVFGPTVDWQVWFQDESSGFWANAEPMTGTHTFDAWATTDFRNADVFVQVQAVADVGSAVTLTVRMAEI